jgi:hypothetical protein
MPQVQHAGGSYDGFPSEAGKSHAAGKVHVLRSPSFVVLVVTVHGLDIRPANGEMAAERRFPRIAETDPPQELLPDKPPMLLFDRLVGKLPVDRFQEAGGPSIGEDPRDLFLRRVLASTRGEAARLRGIEMAPDRPGQNREVGVEEYEVIPGCVADAVVAGGRPPGSPAGMPGMDDGEIVSRRKAADAFHGLLAGTVVGHYHLMDPLIRALEGIQADRQKVRALVKADDHARSQAQRCAIRR